MIKILNIKRKYGELKTFIIFLTIIMVINIIIIYLVDIHEKSFIIGDTKFKYVSLERRIMKLIDDKGNDLIVNNIQGSSFAKNITINYKDSIIRKDVNMNDLQYYIYVDDKLIYEDSLFHFSAQHNDVKEEPEELFEVVLIRNLNEVYSYITEIGIINLIFYSLFFTALGLTNIVFPEKLWQLQHALSVKNGEPTELYITMTQIGGIIILLIGTFISIYVLIN